MRLFICFEVSVITELINFVDILSVLYCVFVSTFNELRLLEFFLHQLSVWFTVAMYSRTIVFFIFLTTLSGHFVKHGKNCSQSVLTARGNNIVELLYAYIYLFIYLFIHDGRTMWPLTPSVKAHT